MIIRLKGSNLNVDKNKAIGNADEIKGRHEEQRRKANRRFYGISFKEIRWGHSNGRAHETIIANSTIERRRR